MNRAKEHERFKLQWMLDHGYTLEDLMKELEKLRSESPHIDLPMIFDHWQFDIGFGSEIWPCYDEWKECEGQDGGHKDELKPYVGDKWYSDEELRQREGMCFECMSENCAYACDGLFHLPLVCGFEPRNH